MMGLSVPNQYTYRQYDGTISAPIQHPYTVKGPFLHLFYTHTHTHRQYEGTISVPIQRTYRQYDGTISAPIQNTYTDSMKGPTHIQRVWWDYFCTYSTHTHIESMKGLFLHLFNAHTQRQHDGTVSAPIQHTHRQYDGSTSAPIQYTHREHEGTISTHYTHTHTYKRRFQSTRALTGW